MSTPPLYVFFLAQLAEFLLSVVINDSELVLTAFCLTPLSPILGDAQSGLTSHWWKVPGLTNHIATPRGKWCAGFRLYMIVAQHSPDNSLLLPASLHRGSWPQGGGRTTGWWERTEGTSHTAWFSADLHCQAVCVSAVTTPLFKRWPTWFLLKPSHYLQV